MTLEKNIKKMIYVLYPEFLFLANVTNSLIYLINFSYSFIFLGNTNHTKKKKKLQNYISLLLIFFFSSVYLFLSGGQKLYQQDVPILAVCVFCDASGQGVRLWI